MKEIQMIMELINLYTKYLYTYKFHIIVAAKKSLVSINLNVHMMANAYEGEL
jgi:hypothetical protein